jgi:cytochrome b pre-mRNA-processing protein 3
MFIHFSILMIIFKKKGSKLDQKSYDYFFHNIEYNLRELGFGDVTVNKKMKEFNKILYDILLKLDKKKDINNTIHLNYDLFINYFDTLKGNKNSKYTKFEDYFVNFFNFCFELPLENMLKEIENFKK